MNWFWRLLFPAYVAPYAFPAFDERKVWDDVMRSKYGINQTYALEGDECNCLCCTKDSQ